MAINCEGRESIKDKNSVKDKRLCLVGYWHDSIRAKDRVIWRFDLIEPSQHQTLPISTFVPNGLQFQPSSPPNAIHMPFQDTII